MRESVRGGDAPFILHEAQTEALLRGEILTQSVNEETGLWPLLTPGLIGA
jgi:hypothetical protein